MEKSPLVSICIPAYNAAKYIGETLNSLVSQNYRNLEIIVVDDHSNDNTIQEVKRISDPRVNVFENPNKGAAAARNFAYQKSSGDFIVFFDADDLVNPGFIQTQLGTIGLDNSATVVSAWGRFVNTAESFQIDPHIVDRDLLFYEWIINYWTHYRHTTPPGRVMMSRATVEKAGLWNEALNLNDDFEFFTRIFLNSSIIKYNSEETFYYRSGTNGLSSITSSSGYLSYFKTLELSLSLAKKIFPADKKIDLACANLWQMFIYHAYPLETNLVNKAKVQVALLGGSNINFPAGGKTQLLTNLIGWKLTKLLKTGIK